MKLLEKIYKILRNTLVGGILLLGAWSLFYILTTESTEPVTVVAESQNITVTSVNIKQVDGKFRYFFNIKNEDTNAFNGDVNIVLVNGEGSSVYDTDFTDASIAPGITKSVYVDASTGPASVHGEYGASTFIHTSKINGQVVSSGTGSISTTK